MNSISSEDPLSKLNQLIRSLKRKLKLLLNKHNKKKLIFFALLIFLFFLTINTTTIGSKNNNTITSESKSKAKIFPKEVIINSYLNRKELYKYPDEHMEKICFANEEDLEKKDVAFAEEPNQKLKETLEEILKNTPMEQMVELIAKQDRIVAAFIVGIAMKESKFGVYSPKKNGRDCYNYWGYKGKENPVRGGYSCFSSPQEAIEKVSIRIKRFTDKGVSSPSQMLAWKCGSSCKNHDSKGITKWIADVSIHFNKVIKANT